MIQKDNLQKKNNLVQIKKIISIIDYLTRPNGSSIKHMADGLNVSERTIYRIIEKIQDDFKFHIDKENTAAGGVRFSIKQQNNLQKISDIKIPNIYLTLQEIIALYFLQSHISAYKGTEIEKHLKAAFTKLDCHLPDKFGDRLEKIQSLFLSSSTFSKDYSGKKEIIEKITDAIIQQKTCIIKYNSFSQDKITSFKIDPLKIIERNGGLYIIIRATTFGDIRLIALERIQSIIITKDLFEYPKNFNAEALLENSFGLHFDEPIAVKIHFSKEQAKYIKERTWSKNQIIQDMADGTIILSMETSGWYDIKKWILSFGFEAQLIEPADKIEEMKTVTNKMASIYVDSY